MHNRSDSVARQRKALLELVQLDMSALETSLPRIVEADARAINVDRVSFWRFDDDRSRLCCLALHQRSEPWRTTAPDLVAKEVPRYIATLFENTIIDAEDALTDPRTAELGPGYFIPLRITSLLDAPVWHHGVLVGVLCHEHIGPPRHWQDFEIDFATSVAGMVAVALEAHARRHAETRYEMLTGAMQDLVWDWNLKTNHIAWSDAVFDGLRFKPGQVTPSFEWWKANVHPQDLQRVSDGLDRHAASGSGVWRDEYRFRRGDGSWAVINDRGVLERAPDGRALRMVGAMVDVSEQRVLQSQLAVADRMVSIGTLAAGVAHEINNPLTYIDANLTFALKVMGNPPARVQSALDDALEGVRRVQAIVQDLKMFSRPEDVEMTNVDVRAVAESAIGLAKNELVHRARLRQEHGETPAVIGNAARLGQVLLNLLINAVQAIPEGPAEENEILVRTHTLPTGRVAIEVRDTGSGVPPEVLGRVFDPFFTTKAIGVGTGLGLSLGHSIVSRMGGTLTLENNPDRGATARIELSAAAAAAEPRIDTPSVAPLPTSSPSRRGKVLVLDDIVNVGISMQRLFAELHDVDVMTSSRQAVAALSGGQRWDVILCDLMMPELNGMEFVAAVEKLDPDLLPRIILMTGGAFTQTARDFLARWPHRKVNKPFDPDRLIAEISRAVDEITARNEG